MALRKGQGQRKKYLTQELASTRNPIQNICAIVREFQSAEIGVLMSQRRQDQLADHRNHLDLQINLLSEQENSKMLAMLAALMRHQGLALDDPEVAALQ